MVVAIFFVCGSFGELPWQLEVLLVWLMMVLGLSLHREVCEGSCQP